MCSFAQQIQHRTALETAHVAYPAEHARAFCKVQSTLVNQESVPCICWMLFRRMYSTRSWHAINVTMLVHAQMQQALHLRPADLVKSLESSSE